VATGRITTSRQLLLQCGSTTTRIEPIHATLRVPEVVLLPLTCRFAAEPVRHDRPVALKLV
jgi:hypothetical protein